MLTATDHNKLHLRTKFMKNPENPHLLNVIESSKEPSNASSRNLFILVKGEAEAKERKINKDIIQ